MITLKELKRIAIDNNDDLLDKVNRLTEMAQKKLECRYILEKRFDGRLWEAHLRTIGAWLKEDMDTFNYWQHSAVDTLIHSSTFIECFPDELNKADYMDLFKLFKYVAIKYSDLYYEKHNKEYYPVLYNDWMQIIADLESEFPELRDVYEVDIWNM